MKNLPTCYHPQKLSEVTSPILDYLVEKEVKVTHLRLSDRDNFKIYKLSYSIPQFPSTLLHLILGEENDCPLDNLPPTLQHLYIGDSFSHPLNNLPPALKVLIFRKKKTAYQHPLTSLPPSLQVFVAPSFQMGEIYPFPPALTHLSLGKYFPGSDTLLMEALPRTLTYFKTYSYIKINRNLPSSVTHLILKANYTEFPVIPDSITHLAFGKGHNFLPPLPPKLTHLYFSLQSELNFKFKCPPSLTHLWLGDKFDLKLDLPITLEFLRCGERFIHNVPFLPCLTQLAVLHPHSYALLVHEQVPSLQEVFVEYTDELPAWYSEPKRKRVWHEVVF